MGKILASVLQSGLGLCGPSPAAMECVCARAVAETHGSTPRRGGRCIRLRLWQSGRRIGNRDRYRVGRIVFVGLRVTYRNRVRTWVWKTSCRSSFNRL